ncbi:DUF4232 domain-containing protein [Dactylosporangium sp. NPDC049525]|uniref:DUF4232 domain-containing protein n=1 Tax=Dactylosporangium sp. NPDC049525 TaxID=3154730 RepID=UPI00342E8E90
MRYAVFISYSHGADDEAAAAIQWGLRRMARPWYRLHALKVFRDRTSLPNSASLMTQLKEAVERSDYLILVASKKSAESAYVNAEVEHFLTHRPMSHLFIAVTEAALPWDARTGRFAPEAEAYLPPVLRQRTQTEPHWADLRTIENLAAPSFANEPFKRVIAGLAAPVHGCELEQLIDQDVRQHRRTMRLAVGVAAGLTVATVLAVVGLVYGVGQGGEAKRQQQRARANQLTAVADHVRAEHPGLAAQFDVAAYRADPESPVAYTNLLIDQNTALEVPLVADAPGVNGDKGNVAMSADGRLLAATTDGNRDGNRSGVELWDLSRPGAHVLIQDGQRGSTPPAPLAFSPDGQRLLVGGPGGVTVWNVAAPAAPAEAGRLPVDGGGLVTSVAFNHGGTTLAVGAADGRFALWTAANPPAPLGRGPAPSAPVGGVVALAFTADDKGLTTGHSDGSSTFWHVADPARPALDQTVVTGTGQAADGFTMALRADGGQLAATDSHGNLAMWALSDAHIPGVPALTPSTPFSNRPVRASAFSPDGGMLAVGAPDGVVTLWNLAFRGPLTPVGVPLALPQEGLQVAVAGLAFSADGHNLVVRMASGRIVVWQLPQRYRVARDTVMYGASSLVASASATQLAVANTGSVLVDVWNLTGDPGPVRVGRDRDGAASTVTAVALGRGLLAVVTEHAPPQVELWSLTGAGAGPATAALAGRLPLTGPLSDRPAVAFSADGSILAVTDDTSVSLWNVRDPAAPSQVGKPHKLAGAAGARGPLVVGADRVGQLWDAADTDAPTPTAALPELAGEAGYSADGMLAATTDKHGLTIWSLASRKPAKLGTAPVDMAPQGGPPAMSPDGRTVAVGEANGTVVLWDVTDPAHPQRKGRPLPSNIITTDDFVTTRRDAQGITAIRFSADGRTLVAVNNDSTIRMWDTDVKAAADAVCARTHGTMTKELWRQYAGSLEFRAPCPAGQPAAVTTTGPVPSAGSTAVAAASTGAVAATSGAAGPPPTAAATGGPCVKASLTLTYGPPAAEHPEEKARLVITNTSAAPCSLTSLPVVVVNGPGADKELRRLGTQPAPVLLAPGGAAHVDIMFTGPPEGKPAWVPATISLVLPYGGGTLSLPWTSGKPVEIYESSSHPPTFSTAFVAGA